MSNINSDIFVFGSKIFPDIKQDGLSSLPLELSWKIFSYLDDLSLRTACQVRKLWHRIILSCKTLKERLNKFELDNRLGSWKLARYFRKNKKELKVEKKKAKRKAMCLKKKTFVPVQEASASQQQQSTTSSVMKKRQGDDIVMYTKRFKLF